MRATQGKQTVTVTADLNLYRMNSNRRECKILEEAYGLECLIKDHTSLTNSLQTLIDVIHTTFRSIKNLDVEKLNKDLQTAPWHNGEAFDDTGDIHFLWQSHK